MYDEQKSTIEIISEHIHKLLFISVPKIIALNIKSLGDSVFI